MVQSSRPDPVEAMFGAPPAPAPQEARREPQATGEAGEAKPARGRGRPPRDGGPVKLVSLYLPEPMHQALKLQAALEGTSMSDWVVRRIEPHLLDAMQAVLARQQEDDG